MVAYRKHTCGSCGSPTYGTLPARQSSRIMIDHDDPRSDTTQAVSQLARSRHLRGHFTSLPGSEGQQAYKQPRHAYDGAKLVVVLVVIGMVKLMMAERVIVHDDIVDDVDDHDVDNDASR
eukprot:2979756-Rhodomonas_salina.1